MSTVALRVGTYRKGGGRGLYALRYDTHEGFALGEPFAEAQNASFGTWSKRHRLHYLVDEQGDGALSVCRVHDEKWKRVARVATGGGAPCYVTLDPAERRIAVGNYASGSVALFQLADDGVPMEAPMLWQNSGGGPNRERQDGPHVHCVHFSPDGHELYAADLGTDQLLRFTTSQAALASPIEVYSAPPGAGPRHFLLHPHAQVSLLLCELASTLSLLKVSGHPFILLAQCSTLPLSARCRSLGGHLALSAAGDRAYVTNRGHDSVGVIAVDAADSLLKPIQHMPSGGVSPRHLLLVEEMQRLLIAHEESGDVTAFRVLDDGALEPTGQKVSVPGAGYLCREMLP